MPVVTLDSFLDYAIAAGVLLLVSGAALVIYGWRRAHRVDIQFPRWPGDLDWSAPAAAEASLRQIHAFASRYSESSREWYRNRRKNKRQMGFGLRLGAILATAAAGIYPIVGPLVVEGPVEVGWSAVLAAVAALFLALDKFGGYTSGWVRYMLAEQEVERLERAFLVEWERLRYEAAAASDPSTTRFLDAARDLILAVFTIVTNETKAWADEFQAALRDIETAATRAREERSAGMIRVEVRNHERLDGPWILEVNGEEKLRPGGAQGSVANLPAGPYCVAVRGTAQGRELYFEDTVHVSPGVVRTAMFRIPEISPHPNGPTPVVGTGAGQTEASPRGAAESSD